MFGKNLSFGFEMSPRPRIGPARNFLAEIFFLGRWVAVVGFDRLKVTQKPLTRGLEGRRRWPSSQDTKKAACAASLVFFN